MDSFAGFITLSLSELVYAYTCDFLAVVKVHVLAR